MEDGGCLLKDRRFQDGHLFLRGTPRHSEGSGARTRFQPAAIHRGGREQEPVRPTAGVGSGDEVCAEESSPNHRTEEPDGGGIRPMESMRPRTAARTAVPGSDPSNPHPRTGPTARPGRAGRGVAHRTSFGRPPANPTAPPVLPASTPRRPTGDRTTGTRATSSGGRQSGSGGFSAFCVQNARSRPARESTFAEPASMPDARGTQLVRDVKDDSRVVEPFEKVQGTLRLQIPRGIDRFPTC